MQEGLKEALIKRIGELNLLQINCQTLEFCYLAGFSSAHTAQADNRSDRATQVVDFDLLLLSTNT